jgi:hypothetical protein
MAGNWIGPLLAIWLTLSGMARYEAPIAGSVRGKGPQVAGAQAQPWSCASATIDHARELARRAAAADLKQFLSSSASVSDCVAVIATRCSPSSRRAAACLRTLRDLHVKLQV